MRRSHLLEYEWNEAAGRQAFEEAVRLCDDLAKHPSGRLSGMISPAQIDTCTEDLLRDSVAAARERGLPFTVHCAQAAGEFHEMVRRHGITPIQWAHQIGLGPVPGRILGHAMFIDEHSWLHWWSKKDIAIMADTGTSVAHCPTPFARYGHTLEHFGKYRQAGVNLGIGTDTVPQNLIEEMRWATVLARIAAEDIRATEMADVFHAATAGGAGALLREDLGRLAPGAKADLVLVDLKNPWMMPARDPLRSLIFHAADRAVRDVYVDGERVVADGRVLTLDQAGALERLTAAQRRMEASVPARDARGRRSARSPRSACPRCHERRAAGPAGADRRRPRPARRLSPGLHPHRHREPAGRHARGRRLHRRLPRARRAALSPHRAAGDDAQPGRRHPLRPAGPPPGAERPHRRVPGRRSGRAGRTTRSPARSWTGACTGSAPWT